MSRMPPMTPNSYGYPRPHGLEYETGADAAVITRFFNAVYAWMAAGLALTALVAWWVSTRPDIMASVFQGPVVIGLFVAEIVLVIAISAATERISPAVATLLYLLYSAINGLTLSGLFFVYAHSTLASAFVVTAGMFGAMSLYGMFTKRDLTALGGLLFMALVGLILASVVSIFWRNGVFNAIINYAGVLIFVGLTAYDTQKLKYIARATANDPRAAARLSVNGALALYLDFLNLFLLLLRIMGNRRN
jgi:FtsH-binding integral membrane protein